MSNTNNPPAQLVTFHAGDYSFGIDVLQVQEVLKRQAMTPVPSAPPEVCGLINLRGHIVTAVGMRQRLNLESLADQSDHMNVIVSLRDGPASILVDAVGDVLTVDPAHYKQRPSALPSPLKEMVTGVYQLADNLLLHLDPEVVCNFYSEE